MTAWDVVNHHRPQHQVRRAHMVVRNVQLPFLSVDKQSKSAPISRDFRWSESVACLISNLLLKLQLPVGAQKSYGVLAKRPWNLVKIHQECSIIDGLRLAAV